MAVNQMFQSAGVGKWCPNVPSVVLIATIVQDVELNLTGCL